MLFTQIRIMKNSVFVKSVFVLIIAGIMAKVIGAIYRIPLTWILGAEGLGFYQLIYPIFALLLVLSSTGTPTAISTMVAERISKGQYASAKKILKISIVTLLIIGVFVGVILVMLSSVLAGLQQNPTIMPLYITIAFAIPFVSVLSAYRGYFQGFMNMMPTAISQIVEQVAKLVFGIGFALWLLQYGVIYATWGAVFGVVVSEVLAVFCVMLCYFKHKKQFKQHLNLSTCTESGKKLLSEFFAHSLPIVLCGFVLPLLQMIDSLLVVKLLNIGGIEIVQATVMWGICSGVVGSLVNLPVALTQSVAVSVAPNMRDVNDNKQNTQNKIDNACVMAINISLPLEIVLFSMAGVIIPFLYQQSITDVDLAIGLLMVYAPFVVVISLVQVQNAVLQGLKFSKIALRNVVLAGICKVVSLICLTTVQSVNIYGLVLSNIAFYVVAYVLNFVSLKNKRCWKISFLRVVPGCVSSVLMGVFLCVGAFAFEMLSVYIKLPLLLFIGASVYFSTMWVMGGLNDVKNWFTSFKKRVYKTKIG